MPAADRPPSGRERRRKDPINRIRRFLYGLLLLAAAPGAAAADELAYIGKFRNTPVASATQRRPVATVQGLVVLRQSDASPQVGLETVTARIHESGAEQAPQFQISVAQNRKIQGGAGFDLAVADFGTFYLNLLVRRDAGSAFALGGALGLVRQSDNAHCLANVPEVRIQGLHRTEARYLAFEASLMHSGAEGLDQLAFRWRA